MNEMNIKKYDILKYILFSFFLYPITINSFSLNYFFVLYPIFFYFKQKTYFNIPIKICLIALAFSLILIGGIAINNISDEIIIIRILISFLIFMSFFSFTLIDIDKNVVNIFKKSLIIISTTLALTALFKFFYYGGNLANYAMKDIVGSQRYGFIYLIGFFCLLYSKSEKNYYQTMRTIILWLIPIGILLTFSRASIVSFVIILSIFCITKITEIRTISYNKIRKKIPNFILAVIAILIIYQIFPFPFKFFDERIISRYFLNEGLSFLSVETSEGIRLKIWSNILNFVSKHPFTGSTYLGVWSLKDINTGSAHSQYMDVLFRVGFIGFIIYMYLLFKVISFLKKEDKGLYWGMLGIMIYGLFHETFKESNGAFILSFLIAMYTMQIRHFPIKFLIYKTY